MNTLKKLILLMFIVSISTFALEPKKHCEQAMHHIFDIVKKTMPKAMVEKMEKDKAKMEKEIQKSIEQCVKKYDKDAVDCVLAAKEMKGMMRCRPKKKKTANEKHCEQAVNHTFDILKKTMPRTRAERMEKNKVKMEEQIERSVEKCAKEYDKDAIDCILATKEMKEMPKCKPKKKKAPKKAEKKAVRKSSLNQ